jgi:glycerol transport system ATP-binding protein
VFVPSNAGHRRGAAGVTLKAENLNLTHNGEIFLNDVSFSAEPGITVLVGPTLSGKTTLMRVLAGLIKPDYGSLSVNGVDVGKTSVKDRSVSFVYQQFINYPSLSVFDNIASPLRVHKPQISKEEISDRVSEVAKMLRISDLLDRKPSALSGGQQQRVAIARSLARKSDLILLDEPLANLDFKLREQLRDELQRIFSNAPMMVVYSTSEPLEALDMATRTIVMDQGHIQQDGLALDMYATPINIPVAQSMSDPPLNLISSTTASTNSSSIGNALKDKFNGDFIVGIRPHNIALNSNSASDIPIKGTVDIAENTGGSTYLHVHLGGSEKLVLELDGSQRFDSGSAITVYLDSSAVFGFDVDSGRTLFSPTVVR